MREQQLRTQAARSEWAPLKAELVRHFDLLWREPELPNMEVRAAAHLSGWAERAGLEVERAPAGIRTAFAARKRTGAGPRIAILAEYDALAGLDNDAVPYRKPGTKRAGHACGHNQIGPANTAAAIAAVRAAVALGLNGEITLIGTPAEEILWGKIALLEAGVLEGYDAILTSHGDYQNGAISRPCQSVVTGELVFTGESGHGGRASGAHALDAIRLALNAIEGLRKGPHPVRFNHMVRACGHMPSVTPDEARLWFSARDVDFRKAEAGYRSFAAAARGVAEANGLGFREQLIAGSRGYLPNDTVAEVLQRACETVGPPRHSNADVAWMEELSRAIRPNEPMRLDRGSRLHREGSDPFGQDDGEWSWRIPTARINWAVPEQVPFHHWGMTALTGSTASHAGPLMASEALAITAVELLASPDLLRAAKAERDRRAAGVDLGAPLLGARRTMREDPASFWDGTWVEE
jgi:aminobenzoyl-glutamate utilization protein B